MESFGFENYGTTFLVGTISFLACYQIIQTLNKKKSRAPPSLPTVPLLGSIPYLPKVMDHKAFTELGVKYGNIYQFYLGSGCMVVLNTYDLLQEAFMKNASELSNRPSFYSMTEFNPHNKGIIDPSPSAEWKQTRNSALSILKDFGFGRKLMEDRIQTEIEALFVQFEKNEGAPYNPDEDITISVSNIINSILFNKRFDYDDQRFKNILSVIGELFVAQMEGNTINVFPVYRFLPGGRGVWKRNKDLFSTWLAFLKEELDDHKLRTDPDDVDSDFISAYKFKSGGNIGESHMLQLIKDFFAAGTETTATTLKWALIRLANQPEIMANLQNEIDSVVGGSRMPSLADKPKMLYTEAFILELLRHSSIAALGGPHCANSDTEIGGYIIPKGATVMPNVWAVHRNEKEWPNPEQFDPTRFLDEDGKITKKDRIVAFGVGKRSCLGEALARQELFLFLTSLLQRFNFSRPPGIEKLLEEPVFGITLAPPEFEIIITSRHK